MTQSRILQRHIEQLHEIRGILHSLKNMAFMEIHRLGQRQKTQNRVVEHIADVATDFLHFFPHPEREQQSSPLIIIVVGSERGFCGNFNDILIDSLPPHLPATLIAVGSRLCNRLNNKQIRCTELPGANSCDEIGPVLNTLIAAIGKVQQQHELIRLSVLSHRDERHTIALQPLFPPFAAIETPTGHRSEPLLNLPPLHFLFELADHYVFSLLQEILVTSLASENSQRLQHLDNAVRHLDQETMRLRRISQIHRQEEITEEIEVILLNAENQLS